MKFISKRLAVCFSSDDDNQPLLDHAYNIASRESCPWWVIYVEKKHLIDSLSRQRIDKDLEKAAMMGAKILRVPNQDIAQGIIYAAELQQITHLIVGKTIKPPLVRIFRSSVASKVLKYDANFELQVVSLGATKTSSSAVQTTNLINTYGVCIFGVLLLTVALELIQEAIPEYRFNASIYNVSMVYLLAVVYFAIRYGFKPALVASVLSFGAYNYFFITPFYQFGINQISDLVNFSLFLSASILSVMLAHAFRTKIGVLKGREYAANALYDLSKDITGEGNLNEVVNSLGRKLSDILKVKVVIYVYDSKLEPLYARDIANNAPKLDKAKQCYKAQQHVVDKSWSYYPVTSSKNNIGVLAIEHDTVDENSLLLEAFSYHTAMAIERSKLMAEAEDIKFQHQRESIRSALLSSVSHDLKTPLVSIIGGLSTLRHMNDKLSTQHQLELVNTAIEEAERLDQFINNILSMTKIEQGDVKPNKQWCDPESLFHDAMHRFASSGIYTRIKVNKSHDDVLIHVDAILITQLLQNLIENAEKYTPNTTTVNLDCRIDGDRCVMEYYDNGPGIPSELRQHVLNKFTRIENRDHTKAGTGLGFAICKAIMDIHGATFELLDSPKDNGGLYIKMLFSEYKLVENES